ncbi:MAG: hypothetical protein ACU0BS_10175 [Hasllibacter sp.]
MPGKATLLLDGPVRFLGRDGTDRTPRGAKVRGLLALLGDADGLRVARARLQDRLWSDRAPEQGAASLRRALSDLRRDLGPERDILTSGPGWVGLDPAAIQVRHPPPGSDPDAFAADLDIDDPEFDDWLRERRARAPAPAPLRTRGLTPRAPRGEAPAVLILPPIGGLAGLAARDAAQRIASLTPAWISETEALAPRLAGRRLRLDGVTLEADHAVQLAVWDVDDGRLLWTQIVHASGGGTLADIRIASSAMTFGLLDQVGLGVLRDLVGFDDSRLNELDDQLARGDIPLAPEAIPALRAFLRYTLRLERVGGARELDEAQTFADQALRLAPAGALPLAVSSIIATERGETAAALDLSRRAIEADTAQLLVPLARITALQSAARGAEALQLSESASRFASSIMPPGDFSLLATASAVLMDRRGDALEHARTARGLAPHLRPALRFVAALAFDAGFEEEAAAALARLKDLEPGFDPRMLADPDYPTRSLQRAGLVQVAKAGLI